MFESTSFRSSFRSPFPGSNAVLITRSISWSCEDFLFKMVTILDSCFILCSDTLVRSVVFPAWISVQCYKSFSTLGSTVTSCQINFSILKALRLSSAAVPILRRTIVLRAASSTCLWSSLSYSVSFSVAVSSCGSSFDFRAPREGWRDQVVGLPPRRLQGSHQARHCQLHSQWSCQEPQAALLRQPGFWWAPYSLKVLNISPSCFFILNG